MRYPTGLKVLAGVFGVGPVILIAGRQWREARELFAAAVFAGAIVAIGLWRMRPRQGAEANRLGLRYSARDPFGLLDERFALLRWSQRSYGRTSWTSSATRRSWRTRHTGPTSRP
jgi:hypothetical protein